MNQKKDFSFSKCLIFATIVILIAHFIFTGRVVEITAAFKPFVFASIFIYLFNPITDFFQQKLKINRILSLLLAYISFFIFVALFLLMIMPSIIESIQLLINNIANINENKIIVFAKNLPIVSEYIDTTTLSMFLSDIENLFLTYASNILLYSTGVLTSIGSIVTSIILIIFSLFMSFYALRDFDNIAERMEEIINAFFSKKIAFHIIRIARLTDSAIKKYLISKMYTCVILAVLMALAMMIINLVTPLRIPYIPLIAVIVGISNLIPYVGAIIGTVPCLLMALFSGVWEAIVLLLIVIVVQQIDNIIITPKIIGDSVGVKPFWVIVSITVGGSLFGAVGMIISVPIISVILHLIDERVTRYKRELKKIKNPEETS